MAAWYVTYRKGDDLGELYIAPDRETAIEVALEMLDEGIKVSEIGPMFDYEPKIAGAEINAIWREHQSLVSR